jgi:tetratricopeptide (TPR) repeat protein
MRALKKIVLCAALFAGVGTLYAHDSPEHEIEALTAKMQTDGTNAALLARRASEWRALQKFDRALADLEQAAALDHASVTLRTEIARVQMAQQRYEPAQQTLAQALRLAADSVERASLHMQRAEVLEAKRDYALALKDCEQAFTIAAPMPDWYLTRARLLAHSGQWSECARGLKAGFEQTGSIVLEIEWIEAMIDAGEFVEALARIEPHLAKARWKAGWLTRRGRAQAGMGRPLDARETLNTALSEIQRRLNTAKADAGLLAERGLAHALLENQAAAAHDLREARRLAGKSGVFAPSIARLERVLRIGKDGKTGAGRPPKAES